MLLHALYGEILIVVPSWSCLKNLYFKYSFGITSLYKEKSDRIWNLEKIATEQKVVPANWTMWKVSLRQMSYIDWHPEIENVKVLKNVGAIHNNLVFLLLRMSVCKAWNKCFYLKWSSLVANEEKVCINKEKIMLNWLQVSVSSTFLHAAFTH